MSGEAARRYLRDPSLRHWVAETTIGPRRDRLRGQLVAHVQARLAGPPAMVVTGVGLRATHRDDLLGPLLVAALCQEAARLGVGEIVALAPDLAVAAHLRALGFSDPPRHVRLLTLPA